MMTFSVFGINRRASGVPMLAFCLCLLLAGIGLSLIGCQGSPLESGQAVPTPIPGCPEGEYCVLVHDWPPFTMTYEAEGTPYTNPDTTIRPLETRRLEYQDRTHWTVTTIASEPFYWGGSYLVDTTGSWERQDGLTYTAYDAVYDETLTLTLEAGDIFIPGGMFSDVVVWGYDIGTRTDGETMVVDTDVCNADDCHRVPPEGLRAAGSPTMGRRYNDPPIQDLVLTDDAWGIPLSSDYSVVKRLEIQPTDPDPIACQTNLREVIVSANLEGQQWDSQCASTHRTDAFAHYYTFDLGEEQMVSIEVASLTVDLYLYLLSGASKTGSVIAENDDLSPTQSLASGLERRLSAGTYTAEVTTNQTGKQNGFFSLAVQAPAPTPTPTPTPTPRRLPRPRPCRSTEILARRA